MYLQIPCIVFVIDYFHCIYRGLFLSLFLSFSLSLLNTNTFTHTQYIYMCVCVCERESVYVRACVFTNPFARSG